tara:strand:- start:13312 stop:16320 length:3009 start_codon:yes stop_codon:yes gene_type:complete
MISTAGSSPVDLSRGQRSINAELERRRQIGLPFFNRDVVAVTGYDRKTINGFTSRFVGELVEELLNALVDDHEAYVRWVRDFQTFDRFIRVHKKSEQVIRRFMRLVIEQFHREGEEITITKVRSITGKDRRIVKEEIIRWEHETGHQVERRCMWKLPATSNIEGAEIIGENHALIRRNNVIRAELGRQRQLGIPFKLADLEKNLGYRIAIISLCSRHYVAELADELLSTQVETREGYEGWRRDYNTFQYSLANTRRSREVLTRLTRLTIEHLHREGETVAYSDVLRVAGHNSSRTKQEIQRWEAETGHRARPLRVWKEITLAMVVARVSSALHKLPLTFLESPEMGRSFNQTQLRMIYNISQPKLRDVAFFVMTFADGNRRNDIVFFASMARYLEQLQLLDIDALETEQFYQKYHDGLVLPEETSSKRGRFLQTYFRLLRKQEDYTRKLTPEQYQSVAPYLLEKLVDDHFWHRSNIHGETRADQKTRRKEATAVVHDKFYLFRDVAERRQIQIERLHTAFTNAIAHHEKTEAGLPLTFSITDETALASGNARKVKQHFKLWNSTALRLAHEPYAEDFYYRRDQQKEHIVHEEGRYFLSYEGGHSEENSGEVAPYWFVELLEARALGYQNSAEFMKRNGYPQKTFLLPPQSMWDLSTSKWLERISKDLGMLFLPVDGLMLAALVGHAAIQIMTKTGARMNEFLQIRLTPEYLSRVSLPEDREAIAFRAIPKGRKAEEPYYIDERCMKALHGWWVFQRDRRQNFGVVPPTDSLKHKIKPAPYLWQHCGRHFNHGHVNAAMCIMLHGITLQTPAGNSVRLTSHLLRHGFATEMRALDTPIDVIALLMKQRDVRVTEYYSQPTPAKLVELQQKIFESRVDLSRTHIRSSAHVKRQIEAAQDQVGALIPVMGGRCTVANQCPAKFACIGCAGNAPDWHKREQVVAYRQAYVTMAAMAETQNLPAERRKAQEILTSCDDVLAEMKLLEETDQAAAAPVALTIKEETRG